jgi:extracellular factor (EF) 3-hydroxypalmitic acid methyl ester biosynthesis protein
VRLSPQRLIYASALVEYLSDRELVRLLDWIHARLEPGGAVVLGTAAAESPDAGFFEHVLGWRLVRRTVSRLSDTFSRSEFGSAEIQVEPDVEQGGLLVMARRSS